MKNSKLKLNANKTEFIIIGTVTQRAKLDGFFPTHILNQSVTPAPSVSNLGVNFDESFNFKQHISKTCRCCFYHIRDLRRIRRFLSLSVAKTIATALVSSRLDYCNSLLYNTANKDIARLQRVQNCLARVVTRSLRFSSSVPLLKSLHWLPVHYRIIFKICTISYQALASKQPTYLNSMLTPASYAQPESYSQPVVTHFTSFGLRRKLEPELSRLLHQLCGIRFLSVSSRKVI